MTKENVCLSCKEWGMKYDQLNSKYLHVLELAKEGADANEYCLRALEQENEKLKTQLVQEQALKEVFFTCYQKKHGDIKGELPQLQIENKKLKQALKNISKGEIGKYCCAEEYARETLTKGDI